MASRTYGREHHERAFQIWYDAGTYAAVRNELSLDFHTIKSWAGPFACADACPWHNWEKLKQEKAAAIRAQMELYTKGIHNPLAHDVAVRAAVGAVPDRGYDQTPTPPTLEDRQRAVATVVRSDLERLSHWEYLYAKVFFEVTGLAVDAKLLVRDGVPLSEEQIREKLGQGLSCKTLDAGIRALATVQQQIEGLKMNLGAYNKAHQPNGEVAVPQPKQSMTIDDLRKFKSLVENTPPEQRELLTRMFRAEEFAFEHIESSAEVVAV